MSDRRAAPAATRTSRYASYGAVRLIGRWVLIDSLKVRLISLLSMGGQRGQEIFAPGYSG